MALAGNASEPGPYDAQVAENVAKLAADSPLLRAAGAEALPGVKAVVTRADFPEPDEDLRDISINVMAADKALYDGHAVAAVAATSRSVARKALRLIEVDYEVLPHVIDVEEAMAEGAPLLHENLFTDGVDPAPDKPSNIATRYEFGHGDVDAGFAEADVVIERSFKTEAAHQGYIEPNACLASVGPDGRGELWCCTQEIGRASWRGRV